MFRKALKQIPFLRLKKIREHALPGDASRRRIPLSVPPSASACRLPTQFVLSARRKQCACAETVGLLILLNLMGTHVLPPDFHLALKAERFFVWNPSRMHTHVSQEGPWGLGGSSGWPGGQGHLVSFLLTLASRLPLWCRPLLSAAPTAEVII